MIARVAIACLCWCAAAWAEPDPNGDAERWMREGLELRKQHRDDEAAERFERAYAATRTPRACAQLALAELALGRWVEAETHLSTALAAKDDPWIARNRGKLDEAFGYIEEHVGGLAISGPAGAALFVNGRALGTLPLAQPLRVVAGHLEVELRLPPRAPVSRGVTVSAGALARESFELAEPPRAPPPTMAAAAPARAVEAAPPPRARSRKALWWILPAAVAVAAGAAVAIYFGVRSDSAPACAGATIDCVPLGAARP